MSNIKDRFEEVKKMTPYERVNQIQDIYLEDAIKSGFLASFLSGKNGFRLEGHSEMSVTRISAVWDAIYRYHAKNPEVKLNSLVEDALIELSGKGPVHVYAALDAIQCHLENEKRGIATFSIKNPQVYEALKQGIIRHKTLFENNPNFRGKLYSNHIMGYAEEVDKQVQAQTGFKIL